MADWVRSTAPPPYACLPIPFMRKSSVLRASATSRRGAVESSLTPGRKTSAIAAAISAAVGPGFRLVTAVTIADRSGGSTTTAGEGRLLSASRTSDSLVSGSGSGSGGDEIGVESLTLTSIFNGTGDIAHLLLARHEIQVGDQGEQGTSLGGCHQAAS